MENFGDINKAIALLHAAQQALSEAHVLLAHNALISDADEAALLAVYDANGLLARITRNVDHAKN